MSDTEEATYSSSSFIADLGGAAGLIFGLNIMGPGLKWIQFSLNLFNFRLCLIR